MSSETVRREENIIHILTRMARLWSGPMAGPAPDPQAVAEWGRLAPQAVELVKRPLALIVGAGLLQVNVDVTLLLPAELREGFNAGLGGEVHLAEPTVPITLHVHGRPR